MTTTIEPPQVPPVPPTPPVSEQPPAPRTPGSARVVAILVACFGALVVLGAAAWAIFMTVTSSIVHSSARTVDTSGVTELDADVSASSFEIVFADVDEAELTVRGAFGAERWTLERDDDALRISSPNGWIGGGWFLGGAGDAVLSLPRSLEGLSADITINAGDFETDGRFDDIDLELNAGRADMQGQASDVSVHGNAGRADVTLAQVSEAELSVSAGELNSAFTGRQPESITIDVSAGSLTAVVPDGEYDVSSDVSAGGFDNRIGSDPSASSTIHVEVSAGQVTLRSR